MMKKYFIAHPVAPLKDRMTAPKVHALPADWYDPVSYTHLDVYKRQGGISFQCRDQHINDLSRLMICVSVPPCVSGFLCQPNSFIVPVHLSAPPISPSPSPRPRPSWEPYRTDKIYTFETHRNESRNFRRKNYNRIPLAPY